MYILFRVILLSSVQLDKDMNTAMITGDNLDNNQHTNKLDILLQREAQVLHR